jgi:hypothetical protein
MSKPFVLCRGDSRIAPVDILEEKMIIFICSPRRRKAHARG